MLTTLSGLAILLPTGANPETTPLTCVTTQHSNTQTTVCLPEEDPSGGYVTQPRMWLDNSPLYSGGWMLQVNDKTKEVTWVDVQERLSIVPA